VKVLLTGRTGQVGWELERMLDDVVATDRAALDLVDTDAIARFVRKTKPDVIINAAAYTAVDKAESEKDLTKRVNAAAPGILAEEAKRLNALLVHYSTDYVFDGGKKNAYVDDDEPNPLSVYGATKLEGEKRIRTSGCRHLILRTSWVYGPRGHNFFLTMKKNAGRPLRVVDDQRGAPTSSRFIAENTVSLISKNIEGLLHLVPSGETTWYGFAREILGAEADITPITTAEYPTAARRPANSVLDNARARKALGALPDWREVLGAVRKSA
jgi:dTDP-4-dehydrorhamnose reductase